MNIRNIDEDPIAYNARNNNIDATLIHIIIKIVSNGNSYKNINNEAIGLMQLNPLTLTEYNIESDIEKLLNPTTNIQLGCRLIRYYYNRHGNNMPLDHVKMINDLWPDFSQGILYKYHEQIQSMYDNNNLAMGI